MKYYSTHNVGHKVSFREAVFQSLPPDNGLYFPEETPALSKSFWSDFPDMDRVDVAFKIARSFVGTEIPEEDLYRIVSETVDFPTPLVAVEPNIHSLELFHGPTWAFKDMGARFLSRCMGHFTEKTGEEVHILVATSGDTGGAVAAGFHGVEGVQVTLLYPEGKVSAVQQRQLTSWGDNITALEVKGSFDDCQKMVKQAFLDTSLNNKIHLSSANSINIARLIPQSFYYFYAFQALPNPEGVVVCVPSGNYGNLTAGLLAWKLGLPVHRFVAASNANTVVPDYLRTGEYHPQPSVQTYANAMDVGAPSNFVRMLEVFGQSYEKVTNMISGFSLQDPDILQTIEQCYQQNNYLLDPHGAIGYAAMQHSLKDDEQGIFLETAHPVKFLDVVEKALGHSIDFGDKIDSLMQKTTAQKEIDADYEALKGFLLGE